VTGFEDRGKERGEDGKEWEGMGRKWTGGRTECAASPTSRAFDLKRCGSGMLL